MKKFTLMVLLIFAYLFTNAQIEEKLSDDNIKKYVETAKKYNTDFQKEVKYYINSLETKKSNKSKKIKVGFGMDVMIELNKGFEFKVKLHDKILVKRSFKRKDELIIFLKYISK